jgi:hypothetical protein
MNTDAKKLLAECERRGLQLEPRGQMLYFGPEENTTPEIVEQLRRHKFEIINALEARQRAACLHLSKQILLGEFDHADNSTRERLAASLRFFPHTLCLRALERLEVPR